MALVPAICTQCGAKLEVDDTRDAAICQHCGTAFVTEKAINNYNITNVNTFNNPNVIINSESELDRLINAAKAYENLNDYENALDTYKKNNEVIPQCH